MVAAGTFRQDLYYRLAVLTIALPALRERREDIAPLVRHFIDKHSRGRKLRITERAVQTLCDFGWPGNVRQLENEVQRALLLAEDVLGIEHLSTHLTKPSAQPRNDLDLKAQVDALERRLVARAMDQSGGNQTRAAVLLGVSRFGLQKMIRRLEL
jgi:transcriptional regulator with PAS, ATPase and Fis domain